MIMIFGTLVLNDDISRWFFHIFFFFLIFFISWAVRGVKGQKMVQNEKKIVCRAPYLRNHAS